VIYLQEDNICSCLLRFQSKIKQMDGNNPKKNNIFLNTQYELALQQTGFILAGNIGRKTLKRLIAIYKQKHFFLKQQSGIFSSLYSDDVHYRKDLHSALQQELQPIYDTIFKDYKSIGNYVITKFPGPQSTFDIHQDTTILDENSYTPLNVWIPLQDTDISNGCLSMVSKSHLFAAPYRGASFAGQFAHLSQEIMPYLLPVKMKAGDILVFDNRILHYSAENTSHKPRVTVMSGIQHQDAAILTCYRKDSSAPIEVFQQPENYLYNYTGFRTVPVVANSGIKVKEKEADVAALKPTDFEKLVAQYQLQRHDAFSESNRNQYCFNNRFSLRFFR